MWQNDDLVLCGIRYVQSTGHAHQPYGTESHQTDLDGAQQEENNQFMRARYEQRIVWFAQQATAGLSVDDRPAER
eukprot:8448926-Lingulodinium_polyedra.AAC.1